MFINPKMFTVDNKIFFCYQENVRLVLSSSSTPCQTFIAVLDISEYNFEQWKIYPIDTHVDVIVDINKIARDRYLVVMSKTRIISVNSFALHYISLEIDINRHMLDHEPNPHRPFDWRHNPSQLKT